MPTTIHDTGITFPDLTIQTTAASAGGQIQTQIFTSPGTWTKPASCTQVRVTVIGGGGGAYTNPGGSGGLAAAIVPVSAPVAVTVGSGAPITPAPSGGTSSFGPFVSATGGSTAPFGSAGSPGSGTVSAGTTIISGATISTSNTSSNFPSIYTGRDGRSLGSGGATPFNVSSPVSAGMGGAGSPNQPLSVFSGGTGGVVVVEFVG